MKIFFDGLTIEKQGLEILKNDLNFEFAENNNDCDKIVSVFRKEERCLEIRLNGKSASISYGGGTPRFFRGMAELIYAINQGKNEFYKSEAPLFETNGAMLDVSRNAVMKVAFVKMYLRKMALMGMNAFMLYTEDTYEIKKRPYFGHLRGRYTAEELRELDDYAFTLGIEIIPCIQLLGHLRTMLWWRCFRPISDNGSVLLVGDEETYRLIDDMLDTVECCFRSKRIHIGMDEAAGLGLGKYAAKNGYKDAAEIYTDHLKRIKGMLLNRGFKPMFWSDMIFHFASKNVENPEVFDPRADVTDEIVKTVPKDFTPVFWDYYHDTEEWYAASLEKSKKFGDDTAFAGGIWGWMGFGFHFSRTLDNTLPALDACKKAGTKHVYATVWHNCAESSLMLSLAGLAIFASYDYENSYIPEAVRECFDSACHANYDDFFSTEKIEFPKGDYKNGYFSRLLLYSDPINGLYEKHIPENCAEYYRNLTFADLPWEYQPGVEILKALKEVLIHKGDFGVRLKKAYDKKDTAALTALRDECDTIINLTERLHTAHRNAWNYYNKPFGFEVLDLRYGAIIGRMTTVKAYLTDYINGEITSIDELDAPRLRADCLDGDAPLHYTVGGCYPDLVSINVLR